MIMRVAVASLCVFILLKATAMACPGQPGKVIFEDDSGGWELSKKDSEIKDHMLLAYPNPRGLSEQATSFQINNLTFSASEGDFCTEFVLPKEPAPDNHVGAGLVFWRSDGKNKFAWLITSEKVALLSKLVNNNWSAIFRDDNNAAIKLEPGAINSLRVLIKEGKLTLFINGTQVKVIRAAEPAGASAFGVHAQVTKASDANPVIQFKSYKVTTGQ
jgi:hypothetical protein